MSGSGRGQRAASTGSEDEGRVVEMGKRKRKSRIKKHIQEKRFVIHPENLCGTTRSELYQAQTNINGCTTIPIDDSQSEREIRDILVAKLPKLEGKRFQFFTKGQTKNYFCPCSRDCQDATHVENPISEWNGKNVKKMARGNRVVYILCLCKETAMTRGHEDEVSSFGSTPAEHVLTPNITPGSTNTSRPAREELLPQSASRDNLNEEEIASLVDTITLCDQNQNMRRTDDNDHDEDDDDDDAYDDAKDDYDEDESDEEEGEEGEEQEEEEEEESLLESPPTQQMHTVVETLVENPYMSNPETVSNGGCASGIAATENRIDPDSAYITLPTGSNTSLFTLGSAHQSQLAFSSPLNTPAEMARSWRYQDRTRTVTLVKISDLTPTGGSVVGGYNFFITLEPSSVERLYTGQYKVMFGTLPPVPAVRINDSILQGTVPPSARTGEVEVKLLNSSEETVSDQTDAVLFTYFDEKKDKFDEERRRKRKNFLKDEITSTADAFEMLSLVFEVVKEVESDSKQGGGPNGNNKAKALHLLRMIAESAAKINAMEFFTIIFSTSVGRTVFKSFKDEEILLEDVARENGHEELACFLQERHSMYQDDENDSDDEVDWEALAKAAKEYQRRNAGRETTGSASSEVSNGYSGDVENLSEHDEIVENCFEEPAAKKETTSDAWCQEEAHTLPSEESVPEFKSCFPKLSDPIVGREEECKEIIDNLALNHWRVGVISGPLGIGKTSVAVEVGHKLLLKGWDVRYHACTHQHPNSELEMLLENHCHCPNLESDLICYDRNEKCPVQGKWRTLLIVDQMENVFNADEADIIPGALKRFVANTLDKVHCLQLLVVTRKTIDLKMDFVFDLKLEPLKSTVAVQLLQSVSQISSVANLEVIAKGCGYNPLAMMIVRALIQKGISENDIISMLSSSDNFWKKLSHNVVRRHLLNEKETLVNGDQSIKLPQNESLTSPLSSLVEIHVRTTDQKQRTVASASVQEAECIDEDEIPSDQKASDPRYCHCRLCMSSDGRSNLTLALGSSPFSLDLTLEDLKDVIQDKDLPQKEERENPHSKGNNERKGPLCSSPDQHSIFNVKDILKKARERILGSNNYRLLCRAKSYVSLDEGVSLPSMAEKEPATNNDQIEPVERVKESRTPYTCVGKPFLRSTPCLNAEGDISAAPSEFEGIPSRKKKTKLVTPLLKKKKIKSSSFLICVAVFALFCLGGIVYINSFKGQEQVNDPVPEVKQPTAFTINVTSARTTIETYPIVQQANQSVPTGDSPPPSIFPKKFRRCRPNEIEMVDPFNCWPCPTCPPGSGLSPPCGSLFSGRTLILCKSCDPGKTFSSTWGGTSCKRCSQCAPNETVVRPCQPSSDVVCSQCQPDQITWISSKREKHECLDCPICPPGFEPSHPCGSTVPYGVLITCVQCREGNTFSAMTDRQQCKRCSSCGRRQRLISRCTKYFDTICGSISSAKCGYDQIQLNQLDSLNRTEITCIDCPLCPAGTELSQPCGTVAYKEIDLFCVSCRPGFTFSDQPSKYGCKPCTSCSPDTVVISHCSVLKDTACSANARCSSNQISFSNGSTRTCIDCIECSVGEEPSIACGSLVTVLPRQQCMSCKPGTFSDIYGTQPCRPCRICDKEESVKRKCRQASDTVCLLCEANEYFDHELWSCAPCSICCKDEEDHFPQECSHLPIRKCKLRMCSSNTFSAKALPATTMETSTAFSAATVRTSLSKYFVLTLVTLVSTVALILTGFVTLVYLRLRLHQRQLQLTFRKTRTKRWRDVAGELTLEELSARHMEVYDWMCRKLDSGFRQEYKRLAKCYDRVSREDRDSLRNKPSPSRCLLSLIETLYPSLTLRDFVNSLIEIGRNDIAQRLIPLVIRSKNKTACSIEVEPSETCV